jgi:hypothetical protein
MAKSVLPFALAAGCLLLGVPQSDACGDKFIRMGRTLRIARSARPASILIYMNPASAVPAAAKDLRLSASLLQAGHRITTVVRQNELEAELKSGAYDIVVGDAAAATLVQQIGAGKTKPRFLPLLHKATKQQLAAAEKEFRCFIAAPGRAYAAVAEIEHVMEQRHKGARAGI